ncbi:unnamed protein product [Caenorhabditis nigoni]
MYLQLNSSIECTTSTPISSGREEEDVAKKSKRNSLKEGPLNVVKDFQEIRWRKDWWKKKTVEKRPLTLNKSWRNRQWNQEEEAHNEFEKLDRRQEQPIYMRYFLVYHRYFGRQEAWIQLESSLNSTSTQHRLARSEF